MSSHVKKFLQGSIISVIGTVLLAVINYLVRRTMSNNMTIEQFGLFYSMWNLCSMFIALTEFGTKSAGTILMTGYLASGRKNHANSIFSLVMIFNIAAGLLMVITLAAASPWLMTHFFKCGNEIIPFMIFLVYMLVASIEATIRSGLTALQEFFYFNVINVSRSLLLLLGLVFLLPVYEIDGAVVCYTFSAMVAAVFSYWLLGRRIKFIPRLGMSKRMVGNVFRLCSWMTISGAGISVIFSADSLCLTWLGSLDGVGLYNVALPLMQLGMSLIVMPMVFIPIASELWKLKKIDEVRHYCRIINGGLLLFLPVVAVVGYYSAPMVITIAFGKQFVAASTALVWLWIGMVFYASAQFNMSALDTGGMQRSSALIVLAAVVLNLILNIIFIPFYGIDGAAAATAMAYFIIALFTSIRLNLRFRKEKAIV